GQSRVGNCFQGEGGGKPGVRARGEKGRGDQEEQARRKEVDGRDSVACSQLGPVGVLCHSGKDADMQ
ncbi:hypothetical protein KUCAC02_019565, partial [Chaenocephalus aceratus]